MKAKRILTVMLAVVMLLGTLLLTACNSTDEPPVTDDTTTAQKPTDTTVPVGGGEGDGGKPAAKEDAAPTADEDYKGRKFNILTLPGTSMIAGQADDSQQISDVIAKRTIYVEETFGIELMLTEVDGAQDYATLEASYLGGDRMYDLVAPHPTNNFAAFMMSGMLQDLNDSVAFDGKLDTSKLWWNQSQVENYEVNDKLFFGVCDITLNKRGFSLIVLNKEKYDNIYTDENIFDIVFDGKWTIQKVTDIALENYNENTDEYGYSMHSGHVRYFFYSAGETLLKKDENGDWVHKYDVSKTSEIAERVFNLVTGPQTFLDQWWNSTFPTCEAWKKFSGEKSLMLYMDLGAFGHMIAAVDFQTAFLPLPMLNEQQDTYYMEAGNGCLGIPNDANDLEYSAVILESLNWHSYHYFRPVYFDSYLSVMVSKNEEDYRVLEMLLNNSIYDLGEMLDTSGMATGMFKEVIINNLSYDVASYIEQYEGFVDGIIQGVLDEIY